VPRIPSWRGDPRLRRVAASITAIWSTVFLLRFVVMGACYWADADPSVLAVVKIVLGLPIAAVAAAMSLRLFTAMPPDTATSQGDPEAERGGEQADREAGDHVEARIE
jgi:hypothetical protein